MKNQDKPLYLLVDNGSLRPEATLSLRKLAADLSAACNITVEAVSLQHAHRVSSEDLGGTPAQTFTPFLKDRIAQGYRDFRMVPLFLGPSRAVTTMVPREVEALREETPDLRVRVASCLCPEDGSGDEAVARMLARAVRHAMTAAALECRPRVAVVDHGSPIEIVTQVRNRVTARLAALLGEEVETVAPCSMERRDGDAYAFNEPLLAGLLREPEWTETSVVVCMLFLQPGRHAGAGGDVAEICAETEAEFAGLSTYRTGLLAEDPALIELLSERLQQMR